MKMRFGCQWGHISVMGGCLLLMAGPGHAANVQLSGTYTEVFDSMGAAGTTTPTGWFVGGRSGVDGLTDTSGNGAITGTTVQVDNGSVAAGSGAIGNYNYGATGNTGSRSLGSISTTSLGHRAMEGRFDNRMGFAITSFEIRYDGKQWRRESGVGSQILVMKYSTDGVNFVNMGAAFDFTSIAGAATGAIDGDTVRTNGIGGVYTPPTPIPENTTFYLRWFDFNDSGVADHGLAVDNVALSNISGTPTSGTLLSFQQEVNGYTGTVDTFLQQINPSTDLSNATPIKWDGEDGGGVDYLLIRFDNIFGVGPGLIAPTDTITSATLTYTVSDTGSTANVNEVAIDWLETDTYNSFGGDAGVQADEYGAAVGSAAGSPLGGLALDVTSSIEAWKNSPTANRGWVFLPGGTDGVQVRSSEDSTVSSRPKLTVLVNGGTPARKILTVKHQPYLQLGDAPLTSTGPGVGLTDQIVIVWQTVESGSGATPDDFFEVQYRRTGDPTFTPAGPVGTIITNSGTRVNRSVIITGLDYNTLYDYQVIHKRTPAAPVVVNTYNGTFRTRRQAGDEGTYLFAAHGDSANINNSAELAQFESVNARIAVASAEFVTLLGDNIYDNGTHDEFDARFDATRVPNNSAYIRNHVEYFCNGNHDSGGSTFGIPSLQNYYCPVPVLGVTSPVAAPVGETAEFNYSFDYGLVHFATIDSTAWGGVNGGTAGFVSATRQANILNWLSADMAASSLPWKVVMTHHPPKSIAGHTDTGEGMAAELVPVLVQRGVDLLLVGHSHNYQRSFPLTGYASGDVTFEMDASGTYNKGSRVIQVVAGTGGRNIDGTVPTSASGWLAKAYGTNNGGKVGPLLVEVSKQQLLVRFTAADNGAVMDEFRVVVPGPLLALNKTGVTPSAWLGDPMPGDSFTVSNAGIGSLNYTITENASWLSVTPTSGSSTGEADPIQIDYDVAGMPAGVYSATISVASPDANNSPKTLTVNLTIQTVLPDFDGDGDVDMEDFGHLQVCLTGTGSNQTLPECQNAKLDGDNDVDAGDILLFAQCLTMADVFPARTCMGP